MYTTDGGSITQRIIKKAISSELNNRKFLDSVSAYRVALEYWQFFHNPDLDKKRVNNALWLLALEQAKRPVIQCMSIPNAGRYCEIYSADMHRRIGEASLQRQLTKVSSMPFTQDDAMQAALDLHNLFPFGRSVIPRSPVITDPTECEFGSAAILSYYTPLDVAEPSGEQMPPSAKDIKNSFKDLEIVHHNPYAIRRHETDDVVQIYINKYRGQNFVNEVAYAAQFINLQRYITLFATNYFLRLRYSGRPIKSTSSKQKVEAILEAMQDYQPRLAPSGQKGYVQTGDTSKLAALEEYVRKMGAPNNSALADEPAIQTQCKSAFKTSLKHYNANKLPKDVYAIGRRA